MRLKEMIILTATYYSKTISEALLNMYAGDLVDLPEDLVVKGYDAYRRNPKNKHFPLPAQIRELVSPEETPEEKAKEIAARIEGAIVKFGYPNRLEAKEYIGEPGWEIVERYGGWSHLCQNHGLSINPASFHAQVRDQLITKLRSPGLMSTFPQLEAKPIAQITEAIKVLPWEKDERR